MKSIETIGNESTQEKRFKCLHIGCNRFYSTMQSRSNHMKKCSLPVKSPGKRAQKRFCKKHYQFMSSVYKHQKVCNASRIFQGKPILQKKVTNQEYSCNICFRKFNRKGKLERYERTYSEDRIEFCNNCDKRFIRNYFLQKHVQVCSETIKGSYVDPEINDFPLFCNISDISVNIRKPSGVLI